MTKEDIDSMHNKCLSILNEEFLNSKDYVPKRRDWLSAYWSGFKSPEQISRVRNTGYGSVLSIFFFDKEFSVPWFFIICDFCVSLLRFL